MNESENYNHVFNLVVSQKIALVQSELSEAIEALHNHKYQVYGLDWSKDTLEDELADALIRILDLAQFLQCDMAWQVAQKIKYNCNR